MARIGITAFEKRKKESYLEGNQCLNYARRYGFDLIKRTDKKGALDRFLIGIPIAPEVIFIEFKSPGKRGTVSPEQLAEIKKLRKMGYKTVVIRSYDEFKKLIKFLYNESRQQKTGQKAKKNKKATDQK